MAQHSSSSSIEDVYRGVINDVINHVREAFLDENVDVDVLFQLKQLWESKVREIGAVDLDGPRHPPPRAPPAQRAVNVTRPLPPSSATPPAAAVMTASSTSVIQSASSSFSQPSGLGSGPIDYPQPLHHHQLTSQSQPPIASAHQQLLHEATNRLVDQHQQRYQSAQQLQQQHPQSSQLQQALTAGQLSQLVGGSGISGDFQQHHQHNSALSSLPPGLMVLSGTGGARYLVRNDPAGLKETAIKKEVVVGSAYRPTAPQPRGGGGPSQVLMLNPQAQSQQLHHAAVSTAVHSQPQHQVQMVAGLAQAQLQSQLQSQALHQIVNMQQQQPQVHIVTGLTSSQSMSLSARLLKPVAMPSNFLLLGAGGSRYTIVPNADAVHQLKKPIATKQEQDYQPTSSSASRLPQLDGGAPGMSDSSTSEEEDEEELQRFQNLGNDKLEDEDAGDEDPLNSDDDQSDDEDLETLFDADNVIVCQFEKIHRARNKWKFTLKDGVMRIDGKEYCFQKCSGDAEW